MSRNYKFGDNEALYFVTFTVVDWIDIFTRNEYKHIIIESVDHCQDKKGLIVCAWVIMTNHLHMIIGTKQNPVKDIVRDMKSYTSRSLRETIINNPKESRKEWMVKMMQVEGIKNPSNINWQLWQQHNHPIELSNSEILKQKLNYIHYNPVKAGFVDEPWFWKYSSATDYYEDKKGLIDIALIESVYHS